MSSLWTPGGEVPVNRDRPEATPRTDPTRGRGGVGGAAPASADDLGADIEISDQDLAMALDGIDPASLTPEQREQAKAMLAEMMASRRQIAAAPAAEVVATHAMGLYELAGIHLSQPSPQLADAAVAIDALKALVETVGNRFGENEQVLRDALQHIQMTFLEVRRAVEGDPPGR